MAKIRPFGCALERFGEFGHAVGVIFCGDVIVYAAGVVDVVNFADAEDGGFVFGQDVEEHGLWRLDGVIVAAFGAAKISWRAGEGARDYSAYAIGAVEQFSGDFAHAIEFGDGDHIFVRGDLEDAVAGGVDDRVAGAHVFCAQFF